MERDKFRECLKRGTGNYTLGAPASRPEVHCAKLQTPKLGKGVVVGEWLRGKPFGGTCWSGRRARSNGSACAMERLVLEEWSADRSTFGSTAKEEQ
jgi:hypothetical protein